MTFSCNLALGAVHKYVSLAHLVESFHTSIYCLLSKIGFDTAENGPQEVCQKLANSFFFIRSNVELKKT